MQLCQCMVSANWRDSCSTAGPLPRTATASTPASTGACMGANGVASRAAANGATAGAM